MYESINGKLANYESKTVFNLRQETDCAASGNISWRHYVWKMTLHYKDNWTDDQNQGSLVGQTKLIYTGFETTGIRKKKSTEYLLSSKGHTELKAHRGSHRTTKARMVLSNTGKQKFTDGSSIFYFLGTEVYALSIRVRNPKFIQSRSSTVRIK